MIKLKQRASPWLGGHAHAHAGFGRAFRQLQDGRFCFFVIEQRNRLLVQLRLMAQRRLQFKIGQIKSGKHQMRHTPDCAAMSLCSLLHLLGWARCSRNSSCPCKSAAAQSSWAQRPAILQSSVSIARC